MNPTETSVAHNQNNVFRIHSSGCLVRKHVQIFIDMCFVFDRPERLLNIPAQDGPWKANT